jgi:hypothetical protein
MFNFVVNVIQIYMVDNNTDFIFWSIMDDNNDSSTIGGVIRLWGHMDIALSRPSLLMLNRMRLCDGL